MSGVLIFADQKQGHFRQVIFEMLGLGKTLAQHLGEELQAVVLGPNANKCTATLGEAGVDKVFIVADEQVANYTTDGYTQALIKLIKQEQPSAVLIAHNAVGKDLAPALAQELQTGQVSDIVAVDMDDQIITFQRPVYAGKAFAHVSFAAEARPMILTIRPKAFPATALEKGRTAAEAAFTPAVDQAAIRQIIKEVVSKASRRVELTEADVVVSGGRGMKGADNFKLLEELADVLGAAVGASRAAVDEGWIEAQYQVGQTGKVVSPSLYIACGISGAIQHLAGISSAKFIVAINKDPEAEIFKVADYGIVGDALELVPLLIEEFKRIMASGAKASA